MTIALAQVSCRITQDTSGPDAGLAAPSRAQPQEEEGDGPTSPAALLCSKCAAAALSWLLVLASAARWSSARRICPQGSPKGPSRALKKTPERFPSPVGEVVGQGQPLGWSAQGDRSLEKATTSSAHQDRSKGHLCREVRSPSCAAKLLRRVRRVSGGRMGSEWHSFRCLDQIRRFQGPKSP